MSLCYFTSGLISTEPRTNEPCESFRLVLHTPQGSAGRTEVLRVVEAEFKWGPRGDGCSALTKLLMQSTEQNRRTHAEIMTFCHMSEKHTHACLPELLWASIVSVIIKAEECLCYYTFSYSSFLCRCIYRRILSKHCFACLNIPTSPTTV